ncbi:MAG: hypothetical protein ACPGJV_13130, partial [Bacteriovoracaceae bacterium]
MSTEKRNILLYFQAHQPLRLRNYFFLNDENNTIGEDLRSCLFDNYLNKEILGRVSTNCYKPFFEMLSQFKSPLNLNFSITGELFDQLIKDHHEVIGLIKKAQKKHSFDFLLETYHHSLSSLYSPKEFSYQLNRHRDLMERVFDYTPTTFRNTELIYHNDLLNMIKDQGVSKILTEGPNWLPANPESAFKHPTDSGFIFTRDGKLSDIVGFQFEDKASHLYPLTAEKYLDEIKRSSKKNIILGWDLETFGEHYNGNPKTLKFLKDFIELIQADSNLKLSTFNDLPLEEKNLPVLSLESPISWADKEKDLSAWRDNDLQKLALEEAYELEDAFDFPLGVESRKCWRKLLNSDHFYYMSLKKGAD